MLRPYAFGYVASRAHHADVGGHDPRLDAGRP